MELLVGHIICFILLCLYYYGVTAMEFIYSKEIDDIILRHNYKILSGKDVSSNYLIYEILDFIYDTKSPKSFYEEKEINPVVSKLINLPYWNNLEKVLNYYELNNISLASIINIIVNNSILKNSFQFIDGLSFTDGNSYITIAKIYDIKTTFSIILHEILHIETKPIFKYIENKSGNKIQNPVKENYVKLLERIIMEDLNIGEIEVMDKSLEKLYKEWVSNSNKIKIVEFIERGVFYGKE